MFDISITVPTTHAFKDDNSRHRFVKLAAGVLSAGQREFSAYVMNGSTTVLEWVLDAGNDWFMFFEQSDATSVRIRHRYGDRKGLESLAGWLAYRWEGTVVATDTPSE